MKENNIKNWSEFMHDQGNNAFIFGASSAVAAIGITGATYIINPSNAEATCYATIFSLGTGLIGKALNSDNSIDDNLIGVGIGLGIISSSIYAGSYIVNEGSALICMALAIASFSAGVILHGIGFTLDAFNYVEEKFMEPTILLNNQNCYIDLTGDLECF